MSSFATDLHQAIRLLTKSPRFTLIVTLTLAIGIASNTIILSTVQSVFVKPMAYPDPGRLVYVSQAYPGFPAGGGQFSYPIFRDIQQQNRTLDSVAAYQVTGPLALTGVGEPVRVPITYCTPSYLKLLGVRATLGRVFYDSEDRFGSADAVVVLSNGFWRRQFAGNAAIVGQTIHFNGHPFTVVGVLSEDFRDSLYEQEFGEQSDAWIPLGLAYAMTGFADPNNRAQGILWGIGHLKPEVTAADARADMVGLGTRFAKIYPDAFRGYGLVARPLKDQLLGMFYAPAWVLTCASAFLLLIGCANVGNLLLARLLTRQRDLAVRAALGASPAQLAWHLLLENALLLFLAAALGLFLSVQGMRALAQWAAGHLPTVIRLQASNSVLLVSVFISLLTGMLFGVAPAMLGSRVDLRDALSRAGRQGQSLVRRRSQEFLVVVEVALALVLLAAAGLLTGSLRKLVSMNLGFQTKNLLTMRLDLRAARYGDPAARARFGKLLVEKLRSLPGAESATIWGPSMLGRATWVYIAYPEGAAPEDPNARLMMGRHSVNPEALANLEIPLLSGRHITWQDTAEQPAVAIISESVAKKMWPGQDPVGKRMRSAVGNFPWVTVIGVARDAHHAQLMNLSDAAAGELPGGLRPQYDAYFPYLQRPNPGVTLAVRTSRDVRAISENIREAVLSLDPTLPVYDLRLLDDRLAEQVAPVRTIAALSGAYALLAMFLAAFGLFAVLGHDVSQRTHEIGIRMAVGAAPGRILLLILREGITLTSVGLVAGFLLASVTTRTVQAMLFGVNATEPAIFAAVAGLLIAVAVLACLIPAKRAMRLDPMSALRED